MKHWTNTTTDPEKLRRLRMIDNERIIRWNPRLKRFLIFTGHGAIVASSRTLGEADRLLRRYGRAEQLLFPFSP